MKKIVYGLLLVLAMAGSVLSQSPTAQFMYEEAEEAFAKQDYKATLVKLQEVEKELGGVYPKTLYLRIMARNEILKAGTNLDYDNLERLRADCAQYLKEYSDLESVQDKLREVYKMSQEADRRKKDEEAVISAQQRSAEGGDVASIKALINRYAGGLGLKKDPQKANYWREKLTTAIAQEDLRAANNGDISAMDRMAEHYEAGAGVKKDTQQASVWRAKAGAARQEAAEKERRRVEEERIRAEKAEYAAKRQRRTHNIPTF